MMTVEFIAFVAGVGLLIAAIIGGGFEVKEIRVPPLGPIPRVLSAVLGAALLLGPTGFASKLVNGASPTPPLTATGGTPPAPAGTPPAPAAAVQPGPAAPGPATPAPVAVPAAAELVPEVFIEDELGINQQYERINVFINGQSAGTLSIDRGEPMQRLVFRARPGDRYQLTGTEATRDGDEVLVRIVRGGGVLPPSPQHRYGLFQLPEHSDRQSLTVAIVMR